MAKEYIDREAAIKSIKNDLPNIVNYRKADAIECLETLPAADVAEVRHGEWKMYGIANICNLCNAYIVVEQGTAELNYCPNCGADLRGDKNE